MFACTKTRLVRALFLSALGLPLLVSAGVGEAFGQGNAAQSTDPTVTGSVQPAAPIRVAKPIGSAAFQQALSLLTGGDPLGAYQAAMNLGDEVERRTIQWAAIRFGGGKVPYPNVERFAKDAPEFDTDTLYRARIEQSLLSQSPSPSEIISNLGGKMPVSLDGQIALAQAYLADGQKDRAARIARYVWVNNFLDRDSEAEVLKSLGALLDNKDYWDRAVHLLMHDRASGTERILDRLTPAQQSLAKARIAVSRKSANAAALIDQVDPTYRDTGLFWFARAQYARDNGDLKGAVWALDQVKGTPPDAAEFWYERRLIARQALASGDAQLAYRAAAGYRQGPEGRLVDANFHAGWIALALLNDPAAAEPHFVRMASLSTLPESIAAANYWLGRTLDALGRKAEARSAYAKAGQFASIYYGQLAREALGEAPVAIRSLPQWRNAEAEFDSRQLVKAVRLLAGNGQPAMAEPLVSRLAYRVTDPGEFVLAARLAQSIDAHHLAILIADIADRKGIPLDLFHFPKDGIPPSARVAAVDNAAIYAIARQESRFDREAVSRTGARGLMQLMPGTAKEVANKVGLAYSATRLTSDPKYNVLLGSTYLETQLKRYEGSLVLAAAAYNAGPGNVNKWLAAYGDPRSSKTDPVVWIEMIPFTETRKYVQRVMGNYLVYRARLGDQSMRMSQALRAIPQ